jgi:hypothetical protein
MKNSQPTQILGHLMHRGSLTPLQAIKRFNCLRLSGRILELRKCGYSIETELVKTHTGKMVARYSMV